MRSPRQLAQRGDELLDLGRAATDNVHLYVEDAPTTAATWALVAAVHELSASVNQTTADVVARMEMIAEKLGSAPETHTDSGPR